MVNSQNILDSQEISFSRNERLEDPKRSWLNIRVKVEKTSEALMGPTSLALGH